MSATVATCSKCNARSEDMRAVCINCGWCLLALDSGMDHAPEVDGLAVLVESLHDAWVHTVSVSGTRATEQLLVQALAEQDRKVALAPKDAKGWAARGELLFVGSRWSDAQRCFDRALLLDPKLSAAWIGRGKALLGIGEYDSARGAFDTALALEAGDVVALIFKSYALACIGDLQQAQETLENAIATTRPLLNAVSDPAGKLTLATSLQLVFAWKAKAHLLAAGQEYDSAIDAFSQALSLDPKNTGAQNNRASLLSYLGRGAEALENLQSENGQAVVASGAATASPPTPINRDFGGYGQQVTQPFSLSPGLARFRLEHNGKRVFSVWLLDAAGNRITLLASHVGPFAGSKAVGIKRAGAYLVNVSADGSWTVHVQQP